MSHGYEHVEKIDRKASVFKRIAIGLLAAAGVLFVLDHWVHVPQFLPYLLIALCPLLHLFHGHGKGGSHAHRVAEQQETRNL